MDSIATTMSCDLQSWGKQQVQVIVLYLPSGTLLSGCWPKFILIWTAIVAANCCNQQPSFHCCVELLPTLVCVCQETQKLQSIWLSSPWKHDHLLSWEYKCCAQLAVVDGVAGRVRMLGGIWWWSPSWEHTSEKPICSLCQVLMGRNPSARILLTASSGNTHRLLMHTNTHRHTQTEWSNAENPRGIMCSAQTNQILHLSYMFLFPNPLHCRAL